MVLTLRSFIIVCKLFHDTCSESLLNYDEYLYFIIFQNQERYINAINHDTSFITCLCRKFGANVFSDNFCIKRINVSKNYSYSQ